MEDNLPVMSLWRFTGNLPVGKLPVNITTENSSIMCTLTQGARGYYYHPYAYYGGYGRYFW